jgi:hypothetical protein
MKPAPSTHHANVHVGEETNEVPSELQKLLARGSTPAPEPSLLDGLLTKPMRGGGSKRRRVVCGTCGDPECYASKWVDE